MSDQSINQTCPTCGKPRNKYRRYCSHACYRVAIKGTMRCVFTPEQRAEIGACYTAGETSYDLGDRFGVSPTTILKVLHQDGVKVKPGGNYKIGPRFGNKAGNWRGGRNIDKNGYVRAYMYPDDPLAVMRTASSQVLEHRVVMARALGRPLFKNETVHHINGDKIDNRLENLQLRKGHHGQGQTHRCAECGSHNIVSGELPD